MLLAALAGACRLESWLLDDLLLFSTGTSAQGGPGAVWQLYRRAINASSFDTETLLVRFLQNGSNAIKRPCSTLEPARCLFDDDLRQHHLSAILAATMLLQKAAMDVLWGVSEHDSTHEEEVAHVAPAWRI